MKGNLNIISITDSRLSRQVSPFQLNVKTPFLRVLKLRICFFTFCQAIEKILYLAVDKKQGLVIDKLCGQMRPCTMKETVVAIKWYNLKGGADGKGIPEKSGA